MESTDNSNIHANTAKIHKAVRAWKDLLLSLDANGYRSGAASITVPFDEHGRIGHYRTCALSPTADDS